MRLILVEGPDDEPLSAPEVGKRLGLPPDLWDDALQALVSAARVKTEHETGRALLTQTWTMLLDEFPCDDVIRVPLPPLQEIVGIAYDDPEGVEQILAVDQYKTTLTEPAQIRPAYGKSWPATRSAAGAVRITFKAGYGNNGDEVPEAIRTAIAIQVSHLNSLSKQNLFVSRERVDGVGETQFVVSDAAGAAIHRAAEVFLQPFRVYI